MKNKIEELLAVISTKFPEIRETLPPGASDTAIARIEKETNLPIPQSLKDLLKITNGDEKWGESPHGFFSYFLYSCNRIIGEYNFFKEHENQAYPDSVYQKDLVKNILYSAKRLPFATDGSGQYLCIDYDPAEKGTYGQIIYLPCAEPEPVSVIADSFDDFVDFLIEEYKNDRFYIDDERTEWGEEEWTEWRQDQQSDYSKVEIVRYGSFDEAYLDLANGRVAAPVRTGRSDCAERAALCCA